MCAPQPCCSKSIDFSELSVSDRYRSRFKNKHTVLPVIHTSSEAQARVNIQIAAMAGADGVFLVNHSISYQNLINIYREIRKDFPDMWVGINCLDLAPGWAAPHPLVEGVWVDNAGIFEGASEQKYAAEIAKVQRLRWDGIYFGGVAFKGQRKVRPENLAAAATSAMPYMDVVTTSGPGTGQEADVDKIRVMKEAIGDFPLAIASGITPKKTPFTAGQVRALAKTFAFDVGKVRLFQVLMPYITNPLGVLECGDVLDFDSSRMALAELVGSSEDPDVEEEEKEDVPQKDRPRSFILRQNLILAYSQPSYPIH